MGKIAFVFAGQGAQYTGMGKELYESSPAARKVFDLADAIRPGTSNQCFSASKEELSRTLNTQPCLFAVDAACAAALTDRSRDCRGVPRGRAASGGGRRLFAGRACRRAVCGHRLV